MAQVRYPLPTKLSAGAVCYWCPECPAVTASPTCYHPRQRRYQAPRQQIVIFCGCGRTTTPPYCDGRSHQQLA